LDTNVLISAALFDGKPEKILRLIEEDKLILVISPAILVEITKVLVNKFQRDEEEVIRFIRLLYDLGKIIRPKRKIRIIKKDSDNRILECALEGKADYIVTGDRKHLIPLANFKNIPIITPGDFLKI
jgi:putative PIN family toxin of toxin-antitoxin system